MSNYQSKTKHPITGEWEMAIWCDDYFGEHHYGVKFPNDPKTYDVDKYDMPKKEEQTNNFLKQLLQQQEREFDEKYCRKCRNEKSTQFGKPIDHWLFPDEITPFEVKSLLLSQKIELLEKVCEIIEKEKEEYKIMKRLTPFQETLFNHAINVLDRPLSTLQETIKEIK